MGCLVGIFLREAGGEGGFAGAAGACEHNQAGLMRGFGGGFDGPGCARPVLDELADDFLVQDWGGGEMGGEGASLSGVVGQARPLGVVVVVLAREELEQLDWWVGDWVRVRSTEAIDPFLLADFFELKTCGVESWEQISGPVEGLMVDKVHYAWAGVGKGDVCDPMGNGVDWEP